MATLTAICSRDMECPKEVVVWNYYDHEHVVGTHYKYYTHFKIVAEHGDWCLVERFYKLPIINLKASSLGLMYMESPNVIRSIQFGKLGLHLHQEIRLDDLGPDRCRVTCTYTMDVPFFARPFEGLYRRILARWFDDTWVEDAPMRLRRWKVWKLGFRDFRGIDYINEKTAPPENAGSEHRPARVQLPVPKTQKKTGALYERPFDESVEVGY
jgi:hypothetical protein